MGHHLQSMIFINDPYFNEPAYEGMRGTAEGSASSLKYNSGEKMACALSRRHSLPKAAHLCVRRVWAGGGAPLVPHGSWDGSSCSGPPASLNTPRLYCPCLPAEIWLNSIRYAMIDQLKNPRPGFEEVTKGACFTQACHAVMHRPVRGTRVAASAPARSVPPDAAARCCLTPRPPSHALPALQRTSACCAGAS